MHELQLSGYMHGCHGKTTPAVSTPCQHQVPRGWVWPVLCILCAQLEHQLFAWETTILTVLLFGCVVNPLGFQALTGHLATILWYSDFGNMYFRLLND